MTNVIPFPFRRTKRWKQRPQSHQHMETMYGGTDFVTDMVTYILKGDMSGLSLAEIRRNEHKARLDNDNT